MKPDGGTFAFAGPADEAELRALLRRSPTAGSARLAFTREPDYFAADGLAGSRDKTLIHRSGEDLDGIGRLAALELHRDGEPRQMAYLGELRLDPGVRGRARVLREGYAALREWAEGQAPDGCFTSIAAENERARRVLENGGRLGLPAYVPITRLFTRLIPVRAAGAAPSSGENPEGIGETELTEFLQREAKKAQLTLTWDAARWPALRRHGLHPGDFVLVREGNRPGGRLVAAGAVWDLRAFRQVVVDGYSGFLRRAWPLLRFLARLRLSPALPAPGETLAQGMIFGAAVEEPRHWAPLLRGLLQAAAKKGLRWLVIAREERDPELAQLRRLVAAREYATRLFEVCWQGQPAGGSWGDFPFRPEVALL